jgi:hypothetical protein
MVSRGYYRGRNPDEIMKAKKSGRKYFYLDDKLYRQLRFDNGNDSITCWCFDDAKVVEHSLAYVKKKRQPSYLVSQAAAMLNRSRMSINHLYLFGIVKKPKRSYNMEKPENKDVGYYRLSEADIYRLHDYYATSMHYASFDRSKTPLPSKAQLASMMKYRKVPYMMTSDGEFVPVWNAPDVEDWL